MYESGTHGEIHLNHVVGAIEAGGSKTVCAVGRSWEEIRDGERFVVPTTTPEATMHEVRSWFEAHHVATPLAAIGVGSFGPLDVRTASIGLTTPKAEWRGFNWRFGLGERLRSVPLALDTDTNAALLAEWRWGAARDLDVAVYVTVGSGVGGAVIVHGRLVHGLLHPEMGHMIVRREAHDELFGTCLSHGDCLEGLASGRAVDERWARTTERLAPDHAAWELESFYLAQAMVNIITLVSPQVIVLGGGLLHVPGLLERIRIKTRGALAGYVDRAPLRGDLDDYLVAPALGDAAGVVGAFALGLEVVTSSR